MSDQRSKLTAMSDQSWMALEEHLPAIKRLADTGLPTSQDDILVIRQCLCVVAADIHVRRGDRLETRR